ncbi:RNA-directed DNA polymerase, eukaryota [Tanacetum coccineum]
MDRDYLERLVTQEEIKEAVWDCGSSKAPGPDGFSFAFVKKYRDIIKKDLRDFINSFFASCDMPYGAPPSSPSFLKASICHMVSPYVELSINRGLDKGVPISPFFSFLVMEGLHTAFADALDDVIITTGWNARDLENIIRVLHVFYLASGLKTNIHKSNIYGIGVNEDEVYNMASNVGCIAGSLGIYYLSIFRAPESVLNDLERIRSNFFWGVLKLLTMLFSKNGVGGCSLLQMIYRLKSLQLFMVMKAVLIIMAAVSRVHGLTLLDPQTFFTRKDQYWCSKSCFFRDMLNEIGHLNIVASEDTCVWNLGPNGTFTVKDARNIIDQKTLPSLPSTSWDKIIPRKVNIFMWRLSLDRLPHRLNLSLRGMDIPAISCSSCNANVESANHIFFECIIASDLWKLVYRWCEIPFVQALSFEAFKDWLSSWHAPKEKKHMLFIISTSVLWWLWRF